MTRGTARGPFIVAPKKQPDLLTVYSERREEIARFLRARLRSATDAEDVVQELYLKLSRAASLEVRNPSAYLFQMALNLARDYRRGQNRARAREASWVESQNTMSGNDAVDESPSAEAAIGGKQRLARLRDALEELPEQCRRAFVMHKLEGLGHQDIATRLGVSRSAVEKYMHVALRHLIDRLGRD